MEKTENKKPLRVEVSGRQFSKESIAIREVDPTEAIIVI